MFLSHCKAWDVPGLGCRWRLTIFSVYSPGSLCGMSCCCVVLLPNFGTDERSQQISQCFYSCKFLRPAVVCLPLPGFGVTYYTDERRQLRLEC